MPNLKRTVFGTGTASRTAALTEAWKKAFDGPIREAALTRALPVRRADKLAPAARANLGPGREPRS